MTSVNVIKNGVVVFNTIRIKIDIQRRKYNQYMSFFGAFR